MCRTAGHHLYLIHNLSSFEGHSSNDNKSIFDFGNEDGPLEVSQSPYIIKLLLEQLDEPRTGVPFSWP